MLNSKQEKNMKQIWGYKDVKKLRESVGNKKIVLVGGCFDVIHLGHTIFLEKAKNKGEKLIVLLESDENIKKIKGSKRPINNQKNRAIMLTKLKMVDYVVNLPKITNYDIYMKIVKEIKPTIIAVSQNDNNLIIKKKQARVVGAKLIKVTNLIPHQSTSRIIEIITKNP